PSKEEFLEIKKLLTRALILIDEILSRKYKVSKNEIEKEIREKGYITKDGYLYKLKKNNIMDSGFYSF
ncbi:MAG: hypothetical protein QXR03_02755, partial [Candidatus Aenigmatarchaeota archaeon]